MVSMYMLMVGDTTKNSIDTIPSNPETVLKVLGIILSTTFDLIIAHKGNTLILRAK